MYPATTEGRQGRAGRTERHSTRHETIGTRRERKNLPTVSQERKTKQNKKEDSKGTYEYESEERNESKEKTRRR